ncbi:hypothetical protein VNO80_29425 [Phaseolus coccineus]|uniref:DUF7086 domain-containing protein n=1 Tax=Phaseolus coccineus TaxID=3886 RepID=A0AAN9LAU7_PHACN
MRINNQHQASINTQPLQVRFSTFKTPQQVISANLLQAMELSADFLSLSPPGYSSKKKRKSSIPKEAPKKRNKPKQVPVTHNNVGEVDANAPMTALLLSTSPVLAPYTASSSNNNSDNYGGPRGAPEDEETIVPPFPWATNKRARIHSYTYLGQKNITRISGNVQCKKCSREFEMELDVVKKWNELLRFVNKKRESMNDRAPEEWMEPVFPKCENCGVEGLAPLLSGVKKKAINWLFLLLSQTLGCCTIKQLKYFCKHTKNHRTASKNHLVYSTFVGLYKQFLDE